MSEGRDNHIKRLAFPFNISFYFYATHATLEVYISYTGDKEDTDKNRNFENFVHKFKASPGHPTGSFTKTNLRKMGDITDKVW